MSNILGQLRIAQLPDPFLVRIYGAADGSRIAQHRGPGTLDFLADGTPFVLAIQPATFGEQTGDYEIEFSIPLLVRKLESAPPNLDLVWQGPTGAAVAIEAATHLAPTNTFAPIAQDISSPGPLRQHFITLPADATGFFRIVEQ